MIGKGAHEIRPATLSEVLKILDKRQGTGTGDEFGFEQQTSLEYAKRFAHLKFSDAEEMHKELVEMGMKSDAAVKVVDLLPKNKSQLMLILQKSELPDKKVPEVEALIEKYSKKAKKFEPKVVEAPVAEAAAKEEKAQATEEGKGQEPKKEEKGGKKEA